MKQFRTYPYLALVLGFILLFSTTGIAVDFHFCSGALKSTSFMGSAPACYDLESSCKFHLKKQSSSSDDQHRDCCNNEQKFMQLKVDLHCPNIPDEVQNLVFESCLHPIVKQIQPQEYSLDTFVWSLPKKTPHAWNRDTYALYQRFLL